MTSSGKIRIYELSRDLNLENKDILDAAKQLSISAKSHSSSISDIDAKKIKSLLLNKKNVKKLKLAWTAMIGGIEGGGIWDHAG